MAWKFPFFKEISAQPARRRGFDAAKLSRLTSTWTTSSQSIDWDLRTALPILRARSRDLANNNANGKKFMQMVRTHIVGPVGFSLQVRVMDVAANGDETVDRVASKAIVKAFWKWAKRGNCDVTGLHSLKDIENLYISSVARDGEALVRKVYGNQAGPFGFQLQILDPERLDHNLNEDLRGGNRIKMGVELNPAGKPVAYYLYTAHPGDNPFFTFSGKTYERIPAEDLYHRFVAERAEQNRGVPWMAAAMNDLENLGGYEESAVVAARVGAAKMGFFETPDGGGEALADEISAEGQLSTGAEPGVFDTMPAGYKFQPFNPDYPHAMFADFVKTCLRKVASGFGVAYNTLSNDLEGVNFSSIRTGVLEERDNWMGAQDWMIESFLDNVFSEWLKFALLNKQILLPNGSALPVAGYDKFNVGIWRGRRWAWVDPTKDADANVTLIESGLKTRRSVIEDQGGDFEDTVAQLAEEQEMLESFGIITKQGQMEQQLQNSAAQASNNALADDPDPDHNG